MTAPDDTTLRIEVERAAGDGFGRQLGRWIAGRDVGGRAACCCGRETAMSDDAVARIAALIVGETDGGGTPAWLTATLPALIGMVRPSRATGTRNARDVRDALTTVERTAGNLTIAAKNATVVRHLAEADPFASSGSWAEILASASEIAKRASLALDLVPGGQGRRSNGAGPPSMQNRTRCAAIVSEIWQAVRDRREIPTSDGACRAADLLWRASGRASPADAHAAERWRRQFGRLAAAEKDHPREFEIIRAAIATHPAGMVATGTSGQVISPSNA